MVDGLCPKKSVSPSEPMFENTAYRAGGAPGVNAKIILPPPQNLWVEAHWFLKFNSSGLRSEET
jgi:hypothetical protein